MRRVLPTFPTIVIDYPWPQRGGAAKSERYGKGKRAADRHYETQKLKSFMPVVLSSGLYRPARHAHLYLWAIDEFHEEALRLMREELGFRFVRTLPWAKRQKGELGQPQQDKKPQVGQGYYFRGAHELCLFGVRGRGVDPSVFTGRSAVVTTMIEGAVREHSVKPEPFYEKVEARSKGPYLDLFSSEDHLDQARPGWTHWGLPRVPGRLAAE